MQKRVVGFVIVLLLSISFVSAYSLNFEFNHWFKNLLGENTFTGKVVSDEQNNPSQFCADDSSLVGYWRFEDTELYSYDLPNKLDSDSSKYTFDTSRYRNTGQINSLNLVQRFPGKVGQALSLIKNGDVSVSASDKMRGNPERSGSEVVVKRNPLNINGGEMTISAWINPPDKGLYSGTTSFIRKGEGTPSRIWDGYMLSYQGMAGYAPAGRKISFCLGVDVGDLVKRIPNPEQQFNSDHQCVMCGTPLVPGNWYYVAATFNETIMKIYLDGLECNSAIGPHTKIVPSKGQDLHLVSPEYNNPNNFTSILDEVAIWNRTLSSYEIANLYNAGDGKEICSPPEWQSKTREISVKSCAQVRSSSAFGAQSSGSNNTAVKQCVKVENETSLGVWQCVGNCDCKKTNIVEVCQAQKGQTCVLNGNGNAFCNQTTPCVENWKCDTWSECINGMQRRHCEDRLGCNSENNRPVTKQSCVII